MNIQTLIGKIQARWDVVRIFDTEIDYVAFDFDPIEVNVYLLKDKDHNPFYKVIVFAEDDIQEDICFSDEQVISAVGHFHEVYS